MHAPQIFGDFGADVIKLVVPNDTLLGWECNREQAATRIALSAPAKRERLIEAVENTSGSDSYAEFSDERDRRQFVVLTQQPVSTSITTTRTKELFYV
jgi:hypothetical protein